MFHVTCGYFSGVRYRPGYGNKAILSMCPKHGEAKSNTHSSDEQLHKFKERRLSSSSQVRNERKFYQTVSSVFQLKKK